MSMIRPVFAAVLLSTLGYRSMAAADRTEPLPDQLQGVGITEHPNVELPKDLLYTDENGQPVRLGDYFNGQKPVILTLNYSNCPMLCHVQLDGLVEGLKQIKWVLGKEYEIVTVSIDPREPPQRANLTKQKYIKKYDRSQSAPGWHFLIGAETNIKTLADTVGFGYTYDKEQDQYIHAAVVMVCTPEGRVSRYLYGVLYEPQTLTFALVEAAQGKVGSTLDQILLYCFHYDAKSGRYAPAALHLMRLGGALTVVVVGVALGAYWRRDVRRRKTPRPSATS